MSVIDLVMYRHARSFGATRDGALGVAYESGREAESYPHVLGFDSKYYRLHPRNIPKKEAISISHDAFLVVCLLGIYIILALISLP